MSDFVDSLRPTGSSDLSARAPWMRQFFISLCLAIGLTCSAFGQFPADFGTAPVALPAAEFQPLQAAAPAIVLPYDLDDAERARANILSQPGVGHTDHDHSHPPFADLARDMQASAHAGHAHVHYDTIEPYETHQRGVFEEYGHAGHTSTAGYPFVHGLSMEIDFVERALEYDLVFSRGADDGEVDEIEFESELVWAINSRMILIAGAPMVSINPIDGPTTTGPGDMDFSFQYLAYGGRRSLLFTALTVHVPTGDADRDLGNGYTTIDPTVFWLYDFLQGTYFQSRFGWETPLSTTGVGSEFHYDMGLYHTILATRDWRIFRFFTPIIETNGLTRLNETDYGRTALNLTTGFRFVLRGSDEMGFGYSFPVSGARDFNDQLILSYRLHF